jgi:hypothetical protein
MFIVALVQTVILIVIVFFSILTWIHRKPGIKSWRPTMTNPFNWVFMPDLLTDAGLKYRKAALCSWELFIGIFVLLFILNAFGLLPS